ncbi:MAG TPA: pyruvate kinase [Ignavibacteria bacterium]|nr:pyruvate kinase [Ignavibacteria bacterium]
MKYKKTKIICTIGPSVDTEEKIAGLVNEGMDAARLNFSHGTLEIHKSYIQKIRKAEESTGKMIAIIQDLPGPKIRVGKLENGFIVLTENSNIIITGENIIGDSNKFSTNYENLILDLKKDEIILLDDGLLKLKVLNVDYNNREALCEVLSGGILKENKGINLPHTDLKLPSLTPRDIEFLEFGLENDVDFIAMSFVRSADDIISIKNLIAQKNKSVPVIAKIERPEAIKNIDSIIQEADLVMVARGDMGVEISTEEVPILQKMIIKKCNEKQKPVITATQMLETMITQYTPTRAETTDIANAILDGTDCVMLSAETSTGLHPELVVRTMKKIILKTETILKSNFYDALFIEDSPENILFTICNSATMIASRVNAKAIISITHTGKTALLLSNHRPTAQIISATNDKKIVRKTKLIWGVESIMIKDIYNFSQSIKEIKDVILKNNIFSKGDRIVLAASDLKQEFESANMILISEI